MRFLIADFRLLIVELPIAGLVFNQKSTIFNQQLPALASLVVGKFPRPGPAHIGLSEFANSVKRSLQFRRVAFEVFVSRILRYGDEFADAHQYP
jgi:hypothetical protein